MSSPPPKPSDGGPGGGRKYGFLAWFVFVLAVGAVLAVAGGCAALVYGPVLTGG